MHHHHLQLLLSLSLLIAAALFLSACRARSDNDAASNSKPAPTSARKHTPAPAPDSILIEVRHAGGLEPPPHTVIITIRADGLVTNRGTENRIPPADAEHLRATLAAMPLFSLTQQQFDQRLKDAGELDISLRGGSGVYTISLFDPARQGAPAAAPPTRTLRLNRPDLYTNSKVPEARQFHEALRLIEQLSR